MIPPIGNLLLMFLAIVAAWLYPQLPSGAPFDSEMFSKTLQWLLIVIAGWNVKSASQKSRLPSVGAWMIGRKNLD